MAGGQATELSEVFDVIEWERVAVKVQQAVSEHAPVSGGEHKTITVEESGVAGTELEMSLEQYIGKGRRAKR